MAIKCPRCHFDNPDTQRFCGECGTPLIPAGEISVTETFEIPKEELTTGATFAGRYQIIEELGKGGMGKVYKAHDIEIKEKVALKLIKPEIAADKKTIERFRNELRLARRIRHKNVCQVFDIGDMKGTYYISMEYVSGEDLKSFIRRSGQLAAGTAIRISKQICEGLAEAHRLGVIHRDLKPSNIMIDKEGQARIMDFGIARSLRAEGITTEGIIIGTPEYMSPEQVEGATVDHRSDIYSLGVILFEMVTGQLPFKGNSAFDIALKHKTAMPEDPRRLNPQVPDDLSRLILRCLDKNREGRYAQAEELLSELASVEKSLTTEEKVALKRKPLVRWKSVFLIGGASLLLAVLIIAGIFILSKGRAKQSIDSIAVLPLKNLSNDRQQEYFTEGMHEALIKELSKIKAIDVISRTSVMRYKVPDKSLPEIARDLNVDAIIEGSTLQEGGRVRINVQLIDARNDRHLWGDKYDREYREILILTSEVARDIARQIEVSLTPQETEWLAGSRPVNPEAHEAYLKGKYYFNQLTAESLTKSIEQYQQAIALDPNYAPAHSGLAEAFMFSALSHGTLLPADAYPRAREAAKTALKIDNNLASAHVSLAWTEIMYYWDWPNAEREINLAIELDPSNAQAHESYYAYLCVMDRKEEALAEIRHAQKLDPLSLLYNGDLGVALSLVGQYEQATKQLQEVLKMNPNFPPAYWALGHVYFLQGKYEESIDWARKAYVTSGEHSFWLAPLGLSCAAAGRKEESLEILEKMKKLYDDKQNISPAWIAAIHEVMGEKDWAFEWLEKAIEEHDPQAPWYKFYNIFKSIRSDPKFKALVKKMNLE